MPIKLLITSFLIVGTCNIISHSLAKLAKRTLTKIKNHSFSKYKKIKLIYCVSMIAISILLLIIYYFYDTIFAFRSDVLKVSFFLLAFNILYILIVSLNEKI